MKKWQFWLLNGCAAAVLVVVFVNISLFLGNRTVQAVVIQQQQFINESIRLARINSQLIRALATTSAQTDDMEIRALLAEHGVTFTFNPDDAQTEQ